MKSNKSKWRKKNNEQKKPKGKNKQIIRTFWKKNKSKNIPKNNEIQTQIKKKTQIKTK